MTYKEYDTRKIQAEYRNALRCANCRSYKSSHIQAHSHCSKLCSPVRSTDICKYHNPVSDLIPLKGEKS